jgi:2,5-diketo-D-gluconate reductase A
VEHHPRLAQDALRRACEEAGVALVAYSPLGTGSLLQTEAVTALAERLGRTPAQVLLRWGLQKGVTVTPLPHPCPARLRSPGVGALRRRAK